MEKPHSSPQLKAFYLPNWLPSFLKVDLVPSIPDKVGLYIVLVALGLLLIGLGSYLKLNNLWIFEPQASTYEECVADGFPVLLTYPSQCVAHGRTFTQKTPTHKLSP